MSIGAIIFSYLSIISLVIPLGYFLYFSGKTSKTSFYAKMIIPFLISVVCFSYFFEPNAEFGWDLIRHHNLLDQMSRVGFPRSMQIGNYTNLYVTNAFFSFVSMNGDYGLLTSIPLAIEFVIFLYLFCSSCKDKQISNGQFAFTFVAFISTFGLMLAISGIRCVLCVSLVILAVYLEKIKRKKRIIAFGFYAISIFIHYFAIILIVLRVLSAFKYKVILLVLISAGIAILTSYGQNLFTSFNSNYITDGLNSFLHEYQLYTLFNYFPDLSTSGRLVWIFDLIIVLFLYLICRESSKTKNLNDTEKRILEFSGLMSIAGLVFSFNYLLLQRFMFFVSFMLLLSLPIYFKYKVKKTRYIDYLVPLCFLWIFFFNDLYPIMVNYIGFWFLAI